MHPLPVYAGDKTRTSCIAAAASAAAADARTSAGDGGCTRQTNEHQCQRSAHHNAPYSCSVCLLTVAKIQAIEREREGEEVGQKERGERDR